MRIMIHLIFSFFFILPTNAGEEGAPYCVEKVCIGDSIENLEGRGYEKFGKAEGVKGFSKTMVHKAATGRLYKIFHLVQARKGKVCDLSVRFDYEKLDVEEIDNLVTQKTGFKYDLGRNFTSKKMSYKPRKKNETQKILPSLIFIGKDKIVFNSHYSCEDTPKDYP